MDKRNSDILLPLKTYLAIPGPTLQTMEARQSQARTQDQQLTQLHAHLTEALEQPAPRPSLAPSCGLGYRDSTGSPSRAPEQLTFLDAAFSDAELLPPGLWMPPPHLAAQTSFLDAVYLDAEPPPSGTGVPSPPTAVQPSFLNTNSTEAVTGPAGAEHAPQPGTLPPSLMDEDVLK